jgi:phytoene dehydrogenase-like protein
MSKGVYTFQGGTDVLIDKMLMELKRNKADIVTATPVKRIVVENGKVTGVKLGNDNRFIRSKVVLSNANLKGTVFDLVGKEHFRNDFVAQAEAVRLNNSSTQVYIAFKSGFVIDESACGDLLFTSAASEFDSAKLLDKNVTSRTFSFYYPKTRPGSNRCYVVSSTNAHYKDWSELPDTEYAAAKAALVEDTLKHLEKYVPNCRQELEYVEAATPKTFERYTSHWQGASFGTKYEGLAVSRGLPQEIAGLYHAGSVGIIMSGWLGAVNYGVIAANDVDAFLLQ